MINKILKLYYKIPSVKFRNPILFRKKDSRSLEWFHQRRKFGFDETALWNLSADFGQLILNDLNDVESQVVSKEQFIDWCMKETSYKLLLWFYKRILVYQEYNCPTFFMVAENIRNKTGQLYLPKEEQKQIVQNLINTLSKRIKENIIDKNDAIALEPVIFHFGW